MAEKMMTRRDFLRVTAGTTVAVTLGPRALGEALAEPAARVVLVRNAAVLGPQGNIQEETLRSMLDDAVKTLLGACRSTYVNAR